VHCNGLYHGVDLMPEDESGKPQTIWCHSIFGAATNKGLVGLTVGDRKPTYMTPEEARSVAADLLQTATAAEMDEVLMTWLVKRMGTEVGQATLVLRDLRQMRDERRAAEPPVENR
jgi:hypothetical protein